MDRAGWKEACEVGLGAVILEWLRVEQGVKTQGAWSREGATEDSSTHGLYPKKQVSSASPVRKTHIRHLEGGLYRTWSPSPVDQGDPGVGFG